MFIPKGYPRYLVTSPEANMYPVCTLDNTGIEHKGSNYQSQCIIK
jgi:hypothetical protein